MAIWHVAPFRFAPAFRSLGVCEHIWPFSLRDIWATLLSPKWAIIVAQMAGDETSLPHLQQIVLHVRQIRFRQIVQSPVFAPTKRLK